MRAEWTWSCAMSGASAVSDASVSYGTATNLSNDADGLLSSLRRWALAPAPAMPRVAPTLTRSRDSAEHRVYVTDNVVIRRSAVW